MLPVLSIETSLSSIAFFFAGIAGVYALWCHRALQQLKRDSLENIEKLSKEVSVYSSASVGIGDRILKLEERLRSLSASQGEVRHHDLDFSYIQAQKLIEQGVDGPTIAANSGLSPSEVNLMQLLHQKNSHS